MKLDKSYKEFMVELKQKIYNSKTKAILSANRLMIELYFDVLNETVKMLHENPSIDIILCSNKDKLEVEYSLMNTTQPMGISTYTVKDRLPDDLINTLPSQEELQNQLIVKRNHSE